MSISGYHRPGTVEEAVALLGKSEGARCLAGGATLVAMMNANLAETKSLVSLGAIGELSGISERQGGGFRIGAMTRHRETASETRLTGSMAVLREAARQIANPVVRNMGTMGGSIAFADPAADYPPALVAAGAEVEIAGPDGRRTVSAKDFFVDWYTTALEPGEIVTAVLVPPVRHGLGIYRKFARVTGDFAIASVALSVSREARGYALRIAIGGCGPTPVRLDEVDAALSAKLGDDAAVKAAGEQLAAACDPVDDTRATAAYRRLVVPRLLASVIIEARKGLAAP